MKLLIKLCAVLFCGFLITGCGKSENIKVSEAQSSDDAERKTLDDSYRIKCLAYKSAKQACATAGDIDKCIQIKLGETDAYMAGSNCVMAGISKD